MYRFFFSFFPPFNLFVTVKTEISFYYYIVIETEKVTIKKCFINYHAGNHYSFQVPNIIFFLSSSQCLYQINYMQMSSNLFQLYVIIVLYVVD